MQQDLHRAFAYTPPDTPLRILHDDAYFVVVSKPSGLLTVPGKPAAHADCMITRLQERFPTATTVHRLDLDTSGLLIFPLTKETHRHLGLQFEKRMMAKSYVARVWGHMTEDRGEVSGPICVDWPNRPKQMIDWENGREAITGWEVIDREDGNITRVRLTPHTGRSHQLRVHMTSIGHPILGDSLYAHDEAFAASERLQLHSESLTLHHPSDGERVTFTDPCPF